MGKLFGTDGVRGIANAELTPELAFQLGRAGAYVLTQECHKPRILIGRDTRISGNMLEAAMIAGITSMGADVINVEVLPTPAIAFLTRYYSADAGVMISASHNPVEYNGIKFFDGRGLKLPDELENTIEDIIHNNTPLPSPTGINIGRIVKVKNAARDYIDFVKETIDVRLDGMRIAIDCANGAASYIASIIFTELGAEVHACYNAPDGTNINKNCGSTYPDVISRIVAEQGVDAGLAFDGDADRMIASDERGLIVDGDKILVICGLDMMSRGKLNHDTVVTTVMSNMGLDIALSSRGCKVAKTTVGDRYVLECMLKEGYSIGGEKSGHTIFLEHNTTGDGIISALQLLSVMVRTGKSLSELADQMVEMPQVLTSVKIKTEARVPFGKDEEIKQLVQEKETILNGMGRILVRASGTEPLVRVMIEGPDIREIEKIAQEISHCIGTKYGA